MPQVSVMLQQWPVLLMRMIKGNSIPESSEMVAEKGTPRSKSEECVLLMQVRKGGGVNDPEVERRQPWEIFCKV